MHVIQLKIKDKAYDKLLNILNKFDKDDIEIIEENQDFISTQSNLNKELNEIETGKAKFISQSEFEKKLDMII